MDYCCPQCEVDVHVDYGIGHRPAATQPAMQAPRPVLQPTRTAGMPAPAVTVPNVKPAAA